MTPLSMTDQTDQAEDSPSRSYGGVGAQERRQQRRQKFIDAGLQVLGTRGLPHTTMRDLCAEARLTDRYFYESFRRVEDVFQAVHAELTNQLIALLSAAMLPIPAPMAMDQMAEAGLRAFFGFVQEDPRRARILLIDALSQRFSTARKGDIDFDAFNETAYVELLRVLFGLMYPAAVELDLDVELVAKTLIGMTVYSGAAWAHDGFDKSLDDMVRYSQFAWRGLDAWIKREIAERAEAVRLGSFPPPGQGV
jgi:AcrR family transcriptional regulator